MSIIIRRNPIRDMAAMQTAMDRLFEDAWRNFQPFAAGEGLLALDIHETDSNYTVVANLPGLTADAFSVTLHDGVLTISGELPQPQVVEGGRVLMQERAFGKFSRSVSLPQPVDAEAVEANFENGVLALNLPKAAHAQPRQIAVKSGSVIRSNN